ncbi:MAG: flagellar export protein FliJ [Desulfobacterales bacterium]|nr:flagellar export protein FliJ [Desulfobacterales bacterium]
MYQFKLEPLLNHRRYQEEVLQKELADHKKALLAEQRLLRDLKDRKRQNLQQLQIRQKEGRPASELKLYVDFIDHLTAEMEAQSEKVSEAQRRFDTTHEALIAAMKKRKALEKLKAKGRRAYEQAELTKERKLLDDVAGHQFILKS